MNWSEMVEHCMVLLVKGSFVMQDGPVMVELCMKMLVISGLGMQ